jgi:lysozyme family protein
MLANLAQSFAGTMKWEGGAKLSLNRNDPGNWTGNKVGAGQLKGTKWGVAAGSHPNLDIAGLTEADASQIFKTEYWDRVAGDNLPSGLDHCVSDDSFNAGPGNATRLCGAVWRQHLGSAHDEIAAFSEARLSFLRSLRTWNTFKGGWAARVAGVEAESFKMSGTPAVIVQDHADKAQSKSSSATKAATGAAAGGAAAGGAPIADGGSHLPWEVAAVLIAIAVVALVVFAWRARAQAHRADALNAAASELKAVQAAAQAKGPTK